MTSADLAVKIAKRRAHAHNALLRAIEYAKRRALAKRKKVRG